MTEVLVHEKVIEQELMQLLGDYRDRICFIAVGSWGLKTMRADSDLDCLVLHYNLSDEELDSVIDRLLSSKELSKIDFDELKLSPFLKDNYYTVHELVEKMESGLIAWRVLSFSLILKSRFFWGNEKLYQEAKEQVSGCSLTNRELMIYIVHRFLNHYLFDFTKKRKYTILKAMIDFAYIRYFIKNKNEVLREWTYHQKKYIGYKNSCSGLKRDPISFFKYIITLEDNQS